MRKAPKILTNSVPKGKVVLNSFPITKRKMLPKPPPIKTNSKSFIK